MSIEFRRAADATHFPHFLPRHKSSLLEQICTSDELASHKMYFTERPAETGLPSAIALVTSEVLAASRRSLSAAAAVWRVMKGNVD